MLLSRFARFLTGALYGAMLLTPLPGAALDTHQPQIVTFAIPAPYPVDTSPQGVNAHGAVTGFYGDRRGGYKHGFLRNLDGTVILFDVPGFYNALPASINDLGDITGTYTVGDNGQGFVRMSDGTFAEFVVPKSYSTYPTSINAKGEITGTYQGSPTQGFVRQPDGSITTFDINDVADIYPVAINNDGTVAGYYIYNTLHGFIRTADGNITTIDPPGSTYTEVNGINEKGEVAGSFADANSNLHGFTRDRSGKITTFDVKNTTNVDVGDIDREGNVAGGYQGRTKFRAFVRNANGKLVTFAPPGAFYTSTIGYQGKYIAGEYTNSDGGYSRGFLGIQ